MPENAGQWLDNQFAGIREDLVEICEINSGSSNLQGLLKAAQWLRQQFPVDCEFSSIALPKRTNIDDLGKEIKHLAAPLLRWDCRPAARRRVLLAIHYDTVFGPEHSFQNCEQIDSDCLRGPGVADAKGGILVIMKALEAYERFAASDELGWTVVLNPDEEIGSPSSVDYFQNIASDFDFGLLFEPALPTGELVSERKGSGNYDIVVRGKSAHAGRHFEDGRNAVTALCEAMLRLDGLNHQGRAGLTVNVGNVVGGGPVNVVPDTAVGRINVRMQDQESADWFEEQIASVISELASKDGIEASYYGKIASPPKSMNAAIKNLMAAIESCSEEVLGEDVKWRSTGGVCDGNKLAAAGLPNIDTLGPIGDGLHSSQEWVKLSSIPQKAKVMVRLLASFAEGRYPELQRQRAGG